MDDPPETQDTCSHLNEGIGWTVPGSVDPPPASRRWNERSRNYARQRNPAAGQCVFRAGGARPPQEEVRLFIDQHRGRFGVELICTLLRVASSAYWRHAARQRDSSLLSARARRDAFLVPHIQRVWQANFQVYGAGNCSEKAFRWRAVPSNA